MMWREWVRVVTNANLAEARMLPRRRDISSVTKPSSGALRRWASGTDRILRGRLGKMVTRDMPSPGGRPMCPKPPTPPTCPMGLRERGWSSYRLCLDPEQDAWVAVVIDWQRAA